MKQSRAFTIVEIMIIVTVITILASIATVSYAGLQKDARNKERESDTTILRTSLEEFYEKNGYYPPRDLVTGETDEVMTFLSRTLDMPPTALTSPSRPTKDIKNSITWSNTSNATDYSYYAQLDNGDPCLLEDEQCTKYRILYKKEVDEEVVLSSKYGW